MRKVWALLLVTAWVLASSLSAPAQFQPPFLTSSPDNVFLLPAPPPGGTGNTPLPLLPDQDQVLPCGAAQPNGGVLCLPQFFLDVPEGSAGLQISVQSGAEFLIFLRFGQQVELNQGRALADLSIQSRNGSAVFAMPPFQPGGQFPGLQAGRYFFAIAHFETSDQRFTVRGAVVAPRPLPLDTPTRLTCTAFEIICLQQFTVQVDRPTGLRLEVRAAGRFSAFVRFGRLVELPALTFDDQGRPQIQNPLADLSATAQDGQIALSLDANSSPPLRVGTYYLALASQESSDLELTLTATLSDQAANQAPRAGFSLAPDQPRVGQAVSFTDGSADPDGRITSWAWDFGDGGTSAERNPTHAYAAPGSYRVSLTVTDDGGASASAAKTLTVLPAPPPPGLTALAFSRLSFVDPTAWQRALQGGCVSYTNVSGAGALVELTDLAGALQSITVPAGGVVWVCGNAAHFDL